MVHYVPSMIFLPHIFHIRLSQNLALQTWLITSCTTTIQTWCSHKLPWALGGIALLTFSYIPCCLYSGFTWHKICTKFPLSYVPSMIFLPHIFHIGLSQNLALQTWLITSCTTTIQTWCSHKLPWALGGIALLTFSYIPCCLYSGFTWHMICTKSPLSFINALVSFGISMCSYASVTSK